MTCRLGLFDVHRELARGGMGVVLAATHREAGAPVAVKLVDGVALRHERYVDDFRAEVQATAELSHPHIVTLLEYGTVTEAEAAASDELLSPHVPYLVMELADSGSLVDERPSDWPTLRRQLLELLGALAHAHAHGVVHRDLKPGNVLLHRGGGATARVKLADFGIAHASDHRREDTDALSQIAGTVAYMAPEQITCQWRDFGPWTDLYAVGIMTHELVSGALPFTGSNAATMLSAHLTEPLPRLLPRFHVPDGLARWVRTLAAKSPEARFRRAADAAYALRALDAQLAVRGSAGDQGGMAGAASPGVVLVGEGAGADVAIAASLEGLKLADLAFAETTPRAGVRAAVRARLRATEPPPASDSSAVDRTAAVAAPPSSGPSTTPGSSQGPEAAPSADAIAPPWSAGGPSPGPGAPPWSGGVSIGSSAAPPWSAGGPAAGSDMAPWSAGGPSAGSGAPPWAAGDDADTAVDVGAPIPVAPIPASWRPEEEARTMALHGAGLGLYFLRPVPMVDRDEERTRIWEALRTASEERAPQALVLRGPTGTGKSRLAEWMARRAHEAGAATLLRATHDTTAGPAHGLPRMIANHYETVGLEEEALYERLEERLTAEGVDDELEVGSLAELLRRARDSRGVPVSSKVRFASAVERHLSVEGVLSRAAEERPVIVWLDDVQLGVDAIALTEHALDHLEAPVLFLLTVQDEALAERDVEKVFIDKLLAHPRAAELSVGPLAPDDTAELVESLLGLKGTLAERVCRRVEGNPLFAVQLVGDWVQRGVLQLTARGFGLRPGERGEIPSDLRAVWATRLDRLFEGRPESDRVVVELIAVLGLSHDEDEVAAVCAAWGSALSDELLDVLARARMVDRDDNGWRFVHAMVRESLVQSARAAHRAEAMHRTCAGVLSARGGKGSAERVAGHLADGGRAAEALAPFLEAARELRDGSEYTRALSMLARREELMVRLGVPDSDPRWGAGWTLRADVHRLDWDFEAARTWANNARGRAEAEGWRSELAESEITLANVARQQGAPDDALAHCRRARELFHRLDDDDGRARAHLAMAILSRQRGEYESAAALYARAFALFEMVEDERGAANAMLGIAHVARHEKRYELAEQKYEAARERCELAGYRAGIANCLMGRADVQRYRGDLEAAEAGYRRAYKLQKSIGSKAILIARLNLGLALMSRGEFAEARGVFEAELPGLIATNKLAYVGWLRCVLLPCAADARDAAAFDAHLGEAAVLTENRALVDEDMAKAAERASLIWRSAGDEPRAAGASKLAARLFRAIGDEAKAVALEAEGS